MKILRSQGIQAYPAKMYNVDSLEEIKWNITNFSAVVSIVLEDIKYYEYKDGFVIFKM